MSFRSPVPRRELAGAALALVILGLALFVPGVSSALHLRDGLAALSPVLIAAVGATLLLAVSQLDLSLGAQMAAGAVLAGGLTARGVPLPLGALLALVAGGLAGAVNGELVALAGLPAVLVTAATGLAVLQGWRWLLSGPPLPMVPPRAVWFGLSPGAALSVLLVVALLVLVGGTILLRREGRADGRHTILARFVLAGALASLAGFLDVIRPSYAALPAEGLQARLLCAALLGGTAAGGTMVGTFAGALILATLGAALPTIPGLAPWEPVVESVLLLGAVVVHVVNRSLPSLPLADSASASPPAPQWLVHMTLLLGALVAIIGVNGPTFMNLENFAEVGRIAAQLALVALPLAALLAEDWIDLSSAGIVALGAAAVAVTLKVGGLGVSAAVLLVVMLGLVLGAVNASLATGPGLLATLITWASGTTCLALAAALVTRARKPLTPMPPRLLALGRGLLFDAIPYPALAAIALALLFRFLPRRQDLDDRPLVRVGGLLLVSALGAALAAVTFVGQHGAIRLDDPTAFTVGAVAAAVLGGAQPGLPGTVFGTMMASVLVAVLMNGIPNMLPGAPSGPIVAALLVGALFYRRYVPTADTAQETPLPGESEY